MKLASLTNLLNGQPMFNILSLAKEMEAKGKHVIHFELGDPSFNTPQKVIDSAKTALDEGRTHYVDSYGTMELRERIIEYTQEHWGFKPTIPQILVSPANSLIDFSLFSIC